VFSAASRLRSRMSNLHQDLRSHTLGQSYVHIRIEEMKRIMLIPFLLVCLAVHCHADKLSAAYLTPTCSDLQVQNMMYQVCGSTTQCSFSDKSSSCWACNGNVTVECHFRLPVPRQWNAMFYLPCLPSAQGGVANCSHTVRSLYYSGWYMTCNNWYEMRVTMGGSTTDGPREYAGSTYQWNEWIVASSSHGQLKQVEVYPESVGVICIPTTTLVTITQQNTVSATPKCCGSLNNTWVYCPNCNIQGVFNGVCLCSDGSACSTQCLAP